MIISVQLINSIIVKENNINLALALYLHIHSDNKKQFIYYSDYLGYGMIDGEAAVKCLKCSRSMFKKEIEHCTFLYQTNLIKEEDSFKQLLKTYISMINLNYL